MRHMEEPGDESNKVGASMLSMVFSLLLVAAALIFVFGFKHYLARRTYTGPKVETPVSVAESDTSTEYLEMDATFKTTMLMIKNVPKDGFYAVEAPGETKGRRLKNGQILEAVQKGTWQGKIWYRLKDGRYVPAGSNVQPLESYTRLKGYLAITYISSSGVRLRSWADFKADNVTGAVYVGDKVPVSAKVVTQGGVSAFITEDGDYITTDSRYLNDYTEVVEDDGKQSEKSEADEKDTEETQTKDKNTEKTESPE